MNKIKEFWRQEFFAESQLWKLAMVSGTKKKKEEKSLCSVTNDFTKN